MSDTRYSVMHPDSGKKSFFSLASQRVYPGFIFLVLLFKWFD